MVTGSTDGIGKEYAKQLAQRGINILLIARNESKLMQVSNEIGKTITIISINLMFKHVRILLNSLFYSFFV